MNTNPLLGIMRQWSQPKDDWTEFQYALGEGLSPTDIDGAIEKSGAMLFFEAKRTYEMPAGQAIFYSHLVMNTGGVLILAKHEREAEVVNPFVHWERISLWVRSKTNLVRTHWFDCDNYVLGDLLTAWRDDAVDGGTRLVDGFVANRIASIKDFGIPRSVRDYEHSSGERVLEYIRKTQGKTP